MTRILLRPKATEDIYEIWDYIALDNMVAADEWIDRIDGQIRLLAAQPQMGRSRPELGEGVRSFPIGRYMIYYTILASAIDIVRVLHSARDVASSFGGPDI